jgi:hypothetical protein
VTSEIDFSTETDSEGEGESESEDGYTSDDIMNRIEAFMYQDQTVGAFFANDIAGFKSLPALRDNANDVGGDGDDFSKVKSEDSDSSPSAAADGQTNNSNNKSSRGAILMGSLVGGVLLGMAVLLFVLKRRSNGNSRKRDELHGQYDMDTEQEKDHGNHSVASSDSQSEDSFQKQYDSRAVGGASGEADDEISVKSHGSRKTAPNTPERGDNDNENENDDKSVHTSKSIDAASIGTASVASKSILGNLALALASKKVKDTNSDDASVAKSVKSTKSKSGSVFSKIYQQLRSVKSTPYNTKFNHGNGNNKGDEEDNKNDEEEEHASMTVGQIRTRGGLKTSESQSQYGGGMFGLNTMSIAEGSHENNLDGGNDGDDDGVSALSLNTGLTGPASSAMAMGGAHAQRNSPARLIVNQQNGQIQESRAVGGGGGGNIADNANNDYAYYADAASLKSSKSLKSSNSTTTGTNKSVYTSVSVMSQLQRYLWGSSKTPVDDIQTITKVDSMGLEQTPQHVETILQTTSPSPSSSSPNRTMAQTQSQKSWSDAASATTSSAASAESNKSSLDQDDQASTLQNAASLALPNDDGLNKKNKQEQQDNAIMEDGSAEDVNVNVNDGSNKSVKSSFSATANDTDTDNDHKSIMASNSMSNSNNSKSDSKHLSSPQKDDEEEEAEEAQVVQESAAVPSPSINDGNKIKEQGEQTQQKPAEKRKSGSSISMMKELLFSNSKKSNKEKEADQAKALDDNDDDDYSDSDDSPWMAVMDQASGNMYYYNEDTEETTWNKPADFVEDDIDGVQPMVYPANVSDADVVNDKDDQKSIKSSGTGTKSIKSIKSSKSIKSLLTSSSKSKNNTNNGTTTTPTTTTTKSTWQAVLDKSSGTTYYFDTDTLQTTWDKPKGFDDATALPPLDYDDDGEDDSDDEEEEQEQENTPSSSSAAMRTTTTSKNKSDTAAGAFLKGTKTM